MDLEGIINETAAALGCSYHDAWIIVARELLSHPHVTPSSKAMIEVFLGALGELEIVWQ